MGLPPRLYVPCQVEGSDHPRQYSEQDEEKEIGQSRYGYNGFAEDNSTDEGSDEVNHASLEDREPIDLCISRRL